MEIYSPTGPIDYDYDDIADAYNQCDGWDCLKELNGIDRMEWDDAMREDDKIDEEE